MKNFWINTILTITLLLITCWSHSTLANPQTPDPNAKSPAFLWAQQQCHVPLSRPADPKYRDLTGVVLDVYVPYRFTESGKCLGREEECISESRFGSEEDRKKALNDLLLRTKAYRPAIHIDNLVKIFSDVLRQNLMSYVLPDQRCKAVDLIIVTNARDAIAYRFKPNILTVKVDVTIIDDTQPPIAALTMGTYRFDPTQMNVWQSITGRSTAVPLDLSDEQIITRIKYFAQSSLVVWSEKGIAATQSRTLR